MDYHKRNSYIAFFITVTAYCIARLIPLPEVLSKDVLKLIDPDSYYHLRRILYTFSNFPDILIFDNFLSYPEGDFVPWPPLFDFVTGFLSLPFKNPIYFICGFNLIIGIAIITVVFMHQLRKSLNSSIISCFLLITSYAFAKISSYGSIDHHVVDVFLVTSFYILFANKANKKSDLFLIFAIVCASFFNWPGAPLYYAPAFLLILVNLYNKTLDNKKVLFLGIAFFLTAVFISLYFLLTTHNVHSYSFRYFSGFQRDFCFFLGLLLILFYLFLIKKLPKLFFFLFFIGLFIYFNNIFLQIINGLGYLSKSSESILMKMVEESTPILFAKNKYFFDQFIEMIVFFTPFLLAYPFIAWKSFKERNNIIFVLTSLYFFILTCFQKRMGIFFMPFFAVILGDFVINSYKKPQTKLLAIPIATYYLIFIAVFALNFKGLLPNKHILKTMDFLYYKTPLQAEFENGNSPYGILSSWDLGHYIISLGNRPAAAHNFIAIAKNNKEKEFLKCVFAKNEEEIIQIMRNLKTPFLVLSDYEASLNVGWSVLFEGNNPYIYKGEQYFQVTENAKELFLYNMLFDYPANQLRFIFESDDLSSGDLKVISVYELVKGVNIVSREQGKIIVTLKTPYRDIELVYNGVYKDGSYFFRIPYSTETVYDVYATEIKFIGKKTINLKFSERDVLEGTLFKL